MAPSSEVPATLYTNRRDAFAAEETRLAGISFRFSLLRGALFLAFVVCLAVILVQRGDPGWGWWAGAGFWLVAFFWVLPYHDRVIKRQRREGELRRINEEGLLRLARDWARLPVPSLPEPDDSERPMARDLNLFGRASVAQLLGTVHTPPGKTVLVDWLLHPAPPEEIVRRQEAVAELAPEIDLRQQLEAHARPMDQREPDIEPFLRWAEGEPWLLRRSGLIWLTRILTILTPAAGLAAVLTPLPAGVFLLLATINIALGYQLRERTHGTFDRIGAREKDFQLYAEALETIAEHPCKAGELCRIAGELTHQDRPAHEWMALLDRRVDLSDVRHSSYLHLPLAALFLWDFHVLLLLERWQRNAGPRVRGWLATLGRFEALAALAGLKLEQPEWCFPMVDSAADRLAVEGLGHPLIADGQRVSNDVEVGPAGTFLLVTGSNMSGKSTLLRSIGVNAVLAQAGGPVAAAALRMPPVTLATSILVEDSLADGVSFFMAELQRIQKVVAAADRAHGEGRVLLYLLDEVLRGTNSYERQVAVRRVVLHLLRHGAIGAVSTHDLQLAEVPELQAAAVPVHFRETIHPGGDPPMTFDYVMRSGVATTVNALKLMELVGLPAES
jgi:membrane protein implicated in regulation of membrane protease activity